MAAINYLDSNIVNIRQMPFVFIYAVYQNPCDITIFVLKTYCEVIVCASHKFIGDFTMGKTC